MVETNTISHLKELNLWFLLSLRDSAMRDIDVACAEFGVTREFAKFVVDLPISQVQRVANTDKVIFKPSIDAEALAALALLPDSNRRAFAAIAGT